MGCITPVCDKDEVFHLGEEWWASFETGWKEIAKSLENIFWAYFFSHWRITNMKEAFSPHFMTFSQENVFWWGTKKRSHCIATDSNPVSVQHLTFFYIGKHIPGDAVLTRNLFWYKQVCNHQQCCLAQLVLCSRRLRQPQAPQVLATE